MVAETDTKTLLHETVDEVTKKRFLFYKVEMRDGSHTYQMIIVDPYMTLNIELSQATAINFIKSFPKI